MAKKEMIVLSTEQAVLRGVRYTQRGRDGWVRTGGGVWPIEDGQPAEGAPEAGGQPGEVVEADRPLARAVRAAKAALGGQRVVVSLPATRLLVRVLKLPLEVREDLAEAVALQMDKLSPFPGEELSVGCEVLSETESALWVFAAAMPAAIFEELGRAVSGANLQIARTDVSALGWLRSLSGQLQLARPGRRVLLMSLDEGWDLLVLDHGVPVYVRGLGAVPDTDALVREITLTLFSVEVEVGSSAISEVLVVSKEAPSAACVKQLQELLGAPIKSMLPPDEDGGVEGVALRTGEGASLDVTPQVWRDAVKEARVRKRVLTGVGIAAAVWAVFMGVLFSGPLVYRQLTERSRAACKAHAKAFKQVSDTRERVNLILSYMDRTYSPLEMLLLVTSAMPPAGLDLTELSYKREEGMKITGEADERGLVYTLKDAVTGNPMFESVTLNGPTLTKNDRHRFVIDAKYKGGTKK